MSLAFILCFGLLGLQLEATPPAPAPPGNGGDVFGGKPGPFSAPAGGRPGESVGISPPPSVKETIDVDMLGQTRSAIGQLTSELACNDADERCALWAAQGECTANPGYMGQSCRRACLQCEDMPVAVFKELLEVVLMGLRSLWMGVSGSSWAQSRKGFEARMGNATSAVLSRFSSRSRVPSPSKYVANALEFLLTEYGAVSEELQSKPRQVAVSAPKGLYAVPQGSLEKAYFVLQNGVRMPLVGFGTWQLSGDECANAVAEALRAGYRHIDTAQGYFNAKAVAEGIRMSGVPRDEVFIVSKVSNYGDYEAGRVRGAIEAEIAALETTYIDLVMLHGRSQYEDHNLIAWRQLEELLSKGVIRAIGLSNFEVRAVQELSEHATVKPMYLQNKYDIYHSLGQYSATDEIRYCEENNIAFMSYSTLNKWPHKLDPLKDAFVATIARRYGKTEAQVLLRWALQMGAGVIPRSSNATRIRENIDLFDFALSETDMFLLNSAQHLIMSDMNYRVQGYSTIDFIGRVKTHKDLGPAISDPFYRSEEQKADKGAAEKPDPTQASVTFTNAGGTRFDMFWVGDDGKEISVGDVEPGESELISTYHGHTFMLRNSRGGLMSKVSVDRTKGAEQTVVVGGTNEGDARVTSSGTGPKDEL